MKELNNNGQSSNSTSDVARREDTVEEHIDKEEHNETPEETSDNVLAAKSEDSTADAEVVFESAEDFPELFEQSMKELQEGQIVTGTVVQITDEYVMVDIGYKSEGQVPTKEFITDEGKLDLQVGDKIDVLLETREDEEGIIKLSKLKADKIKAWDKIIKASQNDGVIEGKVTGRVKGGLSVDVGVTAFLPGSQVDLRPVKNLEKFIGQTLSFQVVKVNRKRGNVVVSRRALLEKELQKKKEETLKQLEVGKIMPGVVKNLTDYGAFVDLGGIDGLLHVTDMSWGRVNHPTEVLKVGDKINVKILRFDPETEKVSLGLKQITPDPWESVDQKYSVGQKIKGKVVKIVDYGAFVELEPGIEGLVHVSEMSWTRKRVNPFKLLEVGADVDVVVLGIDKEKRRISLGMKQAEPDPWTVVAEKYPPGTKIAGRVKSVTDFGIFIGIDEGIDGLVHISDLTWDKRLRHPSEKFKKGQEVEAIVLNVDPENRRFSLGIKQLQEDPWERVARIYHPGSKVSGTVTNVTDFGAFLEIGEGVEGLIHVSELSKDKSKKPSDIVRVGDKLDAVILKINKEERKIALSAKELQEQKEKLATKEYVNTQESATISVGSILKSKLKEKQLLSPAEEEPPEKEEKNKGKDEEEAVESPEST